MILQRWRRSAQPLFPLSMDWKESRLEQKNLIGRETRRSSWLFLTARTSSKYNPTDVWIIWQWSTQVRLHIHTSRGVIAVSLEVAMVVVRNKCYEKICNWSLFDIAQGICELFKFWTKKYSILEAVTINTANPLFLGLAKFAPTWAILLFPPLLLQNVSLFVEPVLLKIL